MLHPSTELRLVDSTVGYGIFATEPIPKGTIITFKDPLDIIVTPELYKSLNEDTQKSVEHFAYVNGDGDANLNWDNSRYINHSCDSNILATESQLSFAIKDIAEGEEITHDYALIEAFMNDEDQIPCECGSLNCRKKVRVADVSPYLPLFISRLNEAFDVALSVEQPMLKLMNPKYRNKSIEALRKHQDCSKSMLAYLEKRSKNFYRKWSKIAAIKVN